PPAIAVALAREKQAIVEEVATESGDSGVGEPGTETVRRMAWSAFPAAPTERAAHQERARIDVDRVFDHRRRVEALYEAGDPQRFAEVTMTQDIDVECIRSELGPVALQP